MFSKEKEANEEFLILHRINTETAAEQFAELLKTNKTYFLNGQWGSGKTDFLNTAKKYSKKKFTILDLWRIQDERTIVTIAFSKIMPVTYWVLKIIIVLSVLISILMTDIVNLGLSKYVGELGIQVAGGIALFVAVWSFFKIKSDALYIWILNKFPFKRRLLIIDDFDRIDSKRQEQTYVLFNLLDSRIPIIFVGNYEGLSKNDDKFLQKIIHRKIELPYVLHPKNIWIEYFKDLEIKLNETISEEFQKVIIGEQRNLREREQFNDYVNHEFFVRKKLNHVQPSQQLLVIYVYLFYPDHYNTLVADTSFNFAKQFEGNDDSITDWSTEEILHSLLYNMQRKDVEGYPYPFAKNKQEYLLYEQPSNSTISELEALILNDKTLNISLLSDVDTDFYSYLQSNYQDFPTSKKERILNATLNLVKQYKESSTIRFILTEKNNEIMPKKIYMGNGAWGIPDKRANKTNEEVRSEIYTSWHSLLTEHGFDFSQEIYLLEKYSELHFHALGILFSDIDITSKEYIESDRKDFLLNVYVSSQNIWAKFQDWPDILWNAAKSLSNEQYLSFFTAQGILEKKGFDFNSIPKDKNYRVLLSKRNFEHPDEIIDYGFVIEKITPKLKELEDCGYTFSKSAKD